MPMQRNRYPADWEAISRRIRFERAQGKCEQCGLAHGAIIMRSTLDPARYMIYDPEKDWHTFNGLPVRLSEIPEEFADSKYIKVVLTVHHCGVPQPDGTPGDRHDKMDCRDENLLALCQRCHFIADWDIHFEKAQLARRAKKQAALEAKHQTILESGQLGLF